MQFEIMVNLENLSRFAPVVVLQFRGLFRLDEERQRVCMWRASLRESWYRQEKVSQSEPPKLRE